MKFNNSVSPVLLKDSSGVVHSVVKDLDENVWLYCDTDVMRDGESVAPDDTIITCVKCLAERHDVKMMFQYLAG